MEIEFADLVGTEKKSGLTKYGGEVAVRSPTAPVNAPDVKAGAIKSWAASDDVFMPIGESHATLPSGLYLRELVVLTQCFGKPFEEAIERLKKMRKSQPESTAPGRGEFGFAGKSVQ